MILTDYLKPERDLTWDYAKQCGVEQAVIRLPDENFDVTDKRQWEQLYKTYADFGFKPVVLEPMPNHLHDHIKIGDEKRDECIEKVIQMLPIMEALGIHTLCFNFMAYVGWLRTSGEMVERGGARVTGFRLCDYKPINDQSITEEELWRNYTYFINAVIPYADQHHIRFALHPDDPPIQKLGNVSRILTSFENIKKAVHVVKSENLGVTLCQATYAAMGEDLSKVINDFAMDKKIFFVHFRDIVGSKYDFHESFHDNGQTDMAKILRIYNQCGIHVPIRVDHVPTMAGENAQLPGYGSLGRLYAIGYLKGMLEMLDSINHNPAL